MSEYKCASDSLRKGQLDRLTSKIKDHNPGQEVKSITLKAENEALKAERDRLTNLLEDVINELDLSDIAIEKHGQLGTEPAELVRLVLAEKDMKISCLKHGMKGE